MRVTLNERRWTRVHILETVFVVINIIIQSRADNLQRVVEEDMTRNCSRDDLDLAAGNMCSVIELLTTGTHFRHIVSILVLLTRLKCMFRPN